MTVTIYTKPAGCFGCTKTKQKFTAAGIAKVIGIETAVREGALA